PAAGAGAASPSASSTSGCRWIARSPCTRRRWTRAGVDGRAPRHPRELSARVHRARGAGTADARPARAHAAPRAHLLSRRALHPARSHQPGGDRRSPHARGRRSLSRAPAVAGHRRRGGVTEKDGTAESHARIVREIVKETAVTLGRAGERLRVTLAWATERVPFYAERLRGGALRGLADLAALPFTRKSDLREHYPFGLLAVPPGELARLHASSGTKGKPTVVGYTAGDLD